MDGLSPAYAAFGARLRAIRRARGLSMRVLTRAIGLSAHSNLADYECGRRLPPRDIVEACERVLSVGDRELSRLREAALARRSTTSGPNADAGAAAPPVPARPSRLPARPVAVAVAAIAVAVAAIAVAALAGWWGPRTGEPRRSARPASVVGVVSSCDTTARILDSVAVRTLPGPGREPVTVGEVSLRFSPSCGLGWTRFVPARPVVAGATGVELSVHRVDDGALTVLRLSQVVGAESDPLLTVPGCVYAEVTVAFVDGTVATARTGCRTG